MSETPTEQPAEQPQEPQEGTERKQESEPKTFDAEYVEKLRKEAAKYRTEARQNADAAKKLAEIEDRDKSEVEKATSRVQTAERERDEARAEVLRLRVATKHGISDEDADLFLTGSDEETLTKQAERLQKRNEDAGKPRSPRPDHTQGKQQASPLDPRAADIAQIESDLATTRRR